LNTTSRKHHSISVVIPVFNERRTIAEVIRRVKEVPREKEIIIVDDGSTDGTRSVVERFKDDPEIRVILQPKNQGKGAALARGFELATKEVVIVQDADLEYDPSEYEILLGPIDRGRADVVYGSRFQTGQRRVLYFRHTLGNRFLTLLSNLFTDLNLTDMETCYKVFRREVIQNIRLESRRFGFEPEITAKLARLGCTIYEVPISYHGRSYEQGKKITWRDGVAAFWHTLRFSLSRRDFVKDRALLQSVLVNPPVIPDHGVLTLETFAQFRRYNRWIFRRFRKHVGTRVLEIGSGIGNIIAEVLTDGSVQEVVATDINATSLQTLEDRFRNDPRLSCVVWDLSGPVPVELRGRRFDTVICSNVLEHIEDHDSALAAMANLLDRGGKLVLLVPAHPFLYCQLDQNLGHFRRYRRPELIALLEKQGFCVEKITNHNFPGAVGWFWAGKIRRKPRVANQDLKFFDKLVPLLKMIDPLIAIPLGGVSLISVARRK
jgi:glycosyltransferase involved in cell wall biosynthesis